MANSKHPGLHKKRNAGGCGKKAGSGNMLHHLTTGTILNIYKDLISIIVTFFSAALYITHALHLPNILSKIDCMVAASILFYYTVKTISKNLKP